MKRKIMSDYVTEFNTNVVVGQFFLHFCLLLYFSCYRNINSCFHNEVEFSFFFDFNSYQFDCCDRDGKWLHIHIIWLESICTCSKNNNFIHSFIFSISFLFNFSKKVQNLFSQTKCLWKRRQN